MRLLVDSLIALMLIGILAGALAHHRHEQRQLEQQRQVQEALAVLYEQTLYHSVVDPEFGRNVQDPLGLPGPLHRFPQTLELAWFRGIEPRNSVALSHPWIDVAPPGDTADHPPDPVLRRPEQAGFWYNPARGLFRARVPQQATDGRTLDLYNRLNNCALPRLVEAEDESRAPLQMLVSPGAVGASQDEAQAASKAAPAQPAGRRSSLLKAAEAKTP